MGHSDTHRRLHELFNSRRFDEIEAHLAAEFMYEDVAHALTIKTAGEFGDYLRGWVASFGDAVIGSAQYLDGPDHSVCTFHGRGVNDGRIGSWPATGRSMDVVFCEVLHYTADGTVLAGELHYDQLTLLGQLGHLSVPGTETGPSAERAVRDLFRTFDSLDAEALKALLATDGQGIDERSRMWIRGREAIEEYITELVSGLSGVRSTLRDIHAREYGETAVVTCWLDQDYTFDGIPTHVAAPTTVVLRREEGRWKAVLIHTVPLPEVADT